MAIPIIYENNNTRNAYNTQQVINELKTSICERIFSSSEKINYNASPVKLTKQSSKINNNTNSNKSIAPCQNIFETDLKFGSINNRWKPRFRQTEIPYNLSFEDPEFDDNISSQNIVYRGLRPFYTLEMHNYILSKPGKHYTFKVPKYNNALLAELRRKYSVR